MPPGGAGGPANGDGGGGGGGGGGPGDSPGGGGGGIDAKTRDLRGTNPGLDQKPEDGHLPGPGSGRKHPDGTPEDAPPGSVGDGEEAAGDLVKLTEGKPLTLADGEDKPGNDSPPSQSFTARDFTYDKTGLPHYPDAVQAVVSSITYDAPDRTEYRTGAGIVTANSFATVVDWYQKNLPGGWQSSTVGDFTQLGAMGQQLSPENILKMLSAGAQNGGSPNPITAPPATAPADRIRISIFKPPAGTPDNRGIMIVQKGDHPVEALLQARVKP